MAWCIAITVAGNKAGQRLRDVSVRQVRPEATHDTLVGSQKDTSISEGHDDLRYPLPAPGI